MAIAASAAMILEGKRRSKKVSRSSSSEEKKRDSPSQGVGVLFSKLFEENESELRKRRDDGRSDRIERQ